MENTIKKEAYYISFTACLSHLEGWNVPNVENTFCKIMANSPEEASKITKYSFGGYLNMYPASMEEVIKDNKGTIVPFKDLMKKRPKNECVYIYLHGELLKNLEDFCKSSLYSMLNIEYDTNYAIYKIKSANTFKSSPANPLTIDTNGNFTVGKEQVRLGRVLKTLFGNNISDVEIEKIVSQFKLRYNIDTSRVQVSEKIGYVYGISNCGGSCMAMKDESFFEIYEDMQSKIAYILNDNEKLVARALIHQVLDEEGQEYTVLDKIYYESEKDKLTLQKWRSEQHDMTRFTHLDKKLISKYPVKDGYDCVPYVDNLYEAVKRGGEIYLSNSCGIKNTLYYDTLRNTNGESEQKKISCYIEDKGEWCVDVEAYSTDAYFCETDGNYYWYNTDLVYISDYGYYLNTDDDVAYDEYEEEWRFVRDLKFCESEQIWTSNEDYIYIEDGEYYGSYEDSTDTTFCEDISGNVMKYEATYIEDKGFYVYHTDEYFEHSNGWWYSVPEDESEGDA